MVLDYQCIAVAFVAEQRHCRDTACVHYYSLHMRSLCVSYVLGLKIFLSDHPPWRAALMKMTEPILECDYWIHQSDPCMEDAADVRNVQVNDLKYEAMKWQIAEICKMLAEKEKAFETVFLSLRSSNFIVFLSLRS